MRGSVLCWIVVCALAACGDTAELSADAHTADTGAVGSVDASSSDVTGPAEDSSSSPEEDAVEVEDALTEDVETVEPLPQGQLSEVVPGGDTLCARGTPFRFFVYSADPQKVVIDFQGGGACWNEFTCGLSGAIFSDSTGDLTQIQGAREQGFLSGVYDFDNPDNPFYGWTLIHVPYCTGDIHWGDATVEYSDDLTIHHRGYRNATAVFDWMALHYPDAERVVSTGCSAGAYGAIGHAPTLAEMYPEAQLTVIADGGSGIITDDFLSGSFPNWNAEANMPMHLDGIAGVDIEDLTLVDFYVAVAKAYPEIRVAQHTTAYDKDQIFYFATMGGDEAGFNQSLVASLESIYAQVDNFRYYLAPGPIHCIHPYDITYSREVGGVVYSDWVRQLVDGDTAPDRVVCEGECRDDPICEGCLDGSFESLSCTWCDGWVP